MLVKFSLIHHTFTTWQSHAITTLHPLLKSNNINKTTHNFSRLASPTMIPWCPPHKKKHPRPFNGVTDTFRFFAGAGNLLINNPKSSPKSFKEGSWYWLMGSEIRNRLRYIENPVKERWKKIHINWLGGFQIHQQYFQQVFLLGGFLPQRKKIHGERHTQCNFMFFFTGKTFNGMLTHVDFFCWGSGSFGKRSSYV